MTHQPIFDLQSSNKVRVGGSFPHLLVATFSDPGLMGVGHCLYSPGLMGLNKGRFPQRTWGMPGLAGCCWMGQGEGRGRIPLCELRQRGQRPRPGGVIRQ